MFQKLIGVLEDGSLFRGRDLPCDPRRHLRLPYEQDVTLQTWCFHADGSPLDLTPVGTLIYFTVKLSPIDDQKYIWKQGTLRTDLGKHVVEHTIAPLDTRPLPFVKGFWEVLHVDSQGKRNALIACSPLWLSPTLTLP